MMKTLDRLKLGLLMLFVVLVVMAMLVHRFGLNLLNEVEAQVYLNSHVVNRTKKMCSSQFELEGKCQLNVEDLVDFTFDKVYIFEKLKYDISGDCEEIIISESIKNSLPNEYCSLMFFALKGQAKGYVRGGCDNSFATKGQRLIEDQVEFRSTEGEAGALFPESSLILSTVSRSYRGKDMSVLQVEMSGDDIQRSFTEKYAEMKCAFRG